MLEKEIEKAVCAYAKEKGFLHYKFTSPGHLGVPDRIFFGDWGRVFLIEFKREGGTPTASQSREACRLTALGIHVYLVNNVPEGKMVVDGEAELAEQSRFAKQMMAAIRADAEMSSTDTRH